MCENEEMKTLLDASETNSHLMTTNNSSDDNTTTGSIPTLRFPQKLWNIVNESNSSSLCWSQSGQTILLNYEDFQHEFLQTANSYFKTTNIASFVRQLNLYGFKKINSHNRPKEHLNTISSDSMTNCVHHEFLHEYFKAGRLDLLSRVCRKTKSKKRLNADNKVVLVKKNNTNRSISKLQLCQVSHVKQ